MSRTLPIFPLGSVLVPTGVLPLHIFEPRYLALMDDLTGAELRTPLITPEFGVVGIERGQEVGGGEVRARIGTLTQLVEAGRFPDGRWMAVTAGIGRFRVDGWLPDDPYPMATVTDLDEPSWVPTDDRALQGVQTLSRRVLAMAVEFGELEGPVDLEWSDDPARAAWQVCATALIGAFDRQRLLEAETVAARLELLTGQLEGMEEVFAFRMGER